VTKQQQNATTKIL